MQTLYLILFLSFVQGIAEFLPISSASHLFLLERFLNFNQGGLTFDLALNLGTLLTIIVYFHKYIWLMMEEIIYTIIGKNKNYSNLLIVKLVISTIPIVIVGYLLIHFKLEKVLRNPLIIGICLIAFGIILYVIDKVSPSKTNFNDINYKNAFIIGLWQVLALVPGVSRSGITITAARTQGVTKSDSVKFSFLIAIPSTLGAIILMVVHLHRQTQVIDYNILLLGIIFSFLFGLMFIHFLLKFLASYSFKVFMVYRIIVGIIVILGSI